MSLAFWTRVGAIATVVSAGAACMIIYFEWTDRHPTTGKVRLTVKPMLPYTDDRVSHDDEVTVRLPPPPLEETPDAKELTPSEEHAWRSPNAPAQDAGNSEQRVPGTTPERPFEWLGRRPIIGAEPSSRLRPVQVATPSASAGLLLPVQIHWTCRKSQLRIMADDALLENRNYGRRILSASDLALLKLPSATRLLRIWGLSQKGNTYREMPVTRDGARIEAVEINCDPRKGATRNLIIDATYE